MLKQDRNKQSVATKRSTLLSKISLFVVALKWKFPLLVDPCLNYEPQGHRRTQMYEDMPLDMKYHVGPGIVKENLILVPIPTCWLRYRFLSNNFFDTNYIQSYLWSAFPAKHKSTANQKYY